MKFLKKIFGGKMPDVTPVQVMAVLEWIGGQAVAFGWMTNETDKKLLSASATLVALGLKFADSHLRGKRAEALAKK